MKGKGRMLWLAAVGVVAVAVVILLLRTSVVEDVKRESARLFEYEFVPNQNVSVDSCGAALGADSIYKDFRKKYRFHFQTVGLASFADSSRMILLSELPPHFETDSIGSIFSKFTHRAEMRKHPIGYDGYVTDMIVLLGNATQENCDNLIKRINKALFFSDYKPTAITLPVEHKRQYFAKENIDYQITLNEFNTWFMENGEGFVRLDDTSKVLTVSDLFSSQSRGVYFSQEPGFVAWAVAKNEDIAGQLSDIRQFVLDADLILGALADSSTLVIIGRERQSALYELPPLQIESILLLAATTEKELSQSLDINDLMAGKMNNGKDWCPTYLSKELENTEFGDLMTITDVLLKDWSERGTIQEGYYRYPEPGYYPFDKPLFRKLGLNELVYNWNTAGAMYAIDCDGYTVYTLNRTGALPVSYFNSQERSESIGYRYESQAYHYFASLCNTDLARVVQYTALYQLFIDNNISYSGNTYPSFPKNKPFLLYKPTVDLLNTIRHLGRDEIAFLADSLSIRTFKADQEKQRAKEAAEYVERKKAESKQIMDAIKENSNKLTKLQQAIDDLLSATSVTEEQLNAIPFAEMTFKMEGSNKVMTIQDLVDDALRRINEDISTPIPVFKRDEWQRERNAKAKQIVTTLQKQLLSVSKLHKKQINNVGKQMYLDAKQKVALASKTEEENLRLQRRIEELDERAVAREKARADNAERKVKELTAKAGHEEQRANDAENRLLLIEQFLDKAGISEAFKHWTLLNELINDAVKAFNAWAHSNASIFSREDERTIGNGIIAKCQIDGLDACSEADRQTAATCITEIAESSVGSITLFKWDIAVRRIGQLASEMRVTMGGQSAGGSNGNADELTNWDGTPKRGLGV